MNHDDYLQQLRKHEKATKWPEIEFDQELTLSFEDVSELELDTDSVSEEKVAV